MLPAMKAHLRVEAGAELLRIRSELSLGNHRIAIPIDRTLCVGAYNNPDIWLRRGAAQSWLERIGLRPLAFSISLSESGWVIHKRSKTSPLRKDERIDLGKVRFAFEGGLAQAQLDRFVAMMEGSPFRTRPRLRDILQGDSPQRIEQYLAIWHRLGGRVSFNRIQSWGPPDDADVRADQWLEMEKRATFLVEEGPNAGARFELGAERFSIGRAPTNDLCIKEAKVSRVHAELIWEPSGLRLYDCGSAGGTWINERRIQSAIIQEGDRLSFSATTVLRCVSCGIPEQDPKSPGAVFVATQDTIA